MDPVTHTLTGAALSTAGLRRATPLATATLVLAANAPDVDAVTRLGGTYTYLALHRGATHGVAGLLLLPLLVTGVALLWDRWVRRARAPDRPPARPGPLLGLAFVGVLSHLFLDWLNTYGIRWLAPLDGRWFYGDALFILDPWLWLILGGVLFLDHSSSRAGQVGWAMLAGFLSLLVLVPDLAPLPAKLLWVTGLGVLVLLRARRSADPRTRTGERRARVGLALATVYVAGMLALAHLARGEVVRTLEARGSGPALDVMVGPMPANPFSRSVVARTDGAYHLGSFHWLESPRLRIGGDSILVRAPDRVESAALATPEARSFLVWSRFPFRRVMEDGDGYQVQILDARYVDRGGRSALAGVVVRLDRGLGRVNDP